MLFKSSCSFSVDDVLLSRFRLLLIILITEDRPQFVCRVIVQTVFIRKLKLCVLSKLLEFPITVGKKGI